MSAVKFEQLPQQKGNSWATRLWLERLAASGSDMRITYYRADGRPVTGTAPEVLRELAR